MVKYQVKAVDTEEGGRIFTLESRLLTEYVLRAFHVLKGDEFHEQDTFWVVIESEEGGRTRVFSQNGVVFKDQWRGNTRTKYRLDIQFKNHLFTFNNFMMQEVAHDFAIFYITNVLGGEV